MTINNYLLIDRLELYFKPGLTVVTGETGAGKSIILDALLLVLGGRLSGKPHKDITNPTMLSASFQSTNATNKLLEQMGLESCNELIFRRMIMPDGKSKTYVNDVNVSLSSLAIFRQHLLEICGQHDNRGILDPTTHIYLLDTFGGYMQELNSLAEAFSAYTCLKKEVVALKERSQKADFEVQYLKSIVQELTELAATPDEEEKLNTKRRLLIEGAKVREAYTKAEEILAGSTMATLFTLERELNRYPEFFVEPLKMVKMAVIELQEAKSSIDILGDNLGNSDNDLEKIEDRLFKIRATARKYGVFPAQLSELLEQKQAELENFSNISALLTNKERDLNSAFEAYLALAKSVSEKRKQAAKNLQNAAMLQLSELKLDKADFIINVNNDTRNEMREPIDADAQPLNCEGYTSKGIDTVRFLVSTNPGAPHGYLDKVASGGELSRIMLALKVALARIKSVPVLIFDEIDTGISGAVSNAVGKKLAMLGHAYQVMVVTHQSQVAAYGTNHLLVIKSHDSSKTSITVKELRADEQAKEIARMLSGDRITEESLAAARKLIQDAA